jgi:phospholipid/cholesterol/gamma-HCH transport system ATP-binding protein
MAEAPKSAQPSPSQAASTEASPGKAPSAKPIVEMSHVHLEFGERVILKDLSLSVARRERLVIMGQSGGGKSTTLRLIMGILHPNMGSVKFDGEEVTRMTRPKLNQMRQRIGMVYQYSALISSLSVRDNLALPLEELTDKTEKEIDQIVDEKLSLVGMEETRDYMPAELSGGMKKRIGLARGLVMNPELMLFDEPSAGLDPVVSSVVDELIISLTEKANVTSIVVTHEMDSAFRIATRMAMLYQGKIIEEDRPERFRQSSDPVVSQFVEGRTEGPISTTQS